MSPRPVQQYLKEFVFILLITLFTLTVVNSKPTLPFKLPTSFSLPSFPTFPTLQQIITKRQSDAMKSYSGQRLSSDSLRMIYYSDQTIAVVELGAEKLLLSCELIEIYDDEDGKVFLRKLSKINRPLQISFMEMLTLMEQCNLVDKSHEISKRKTNFAAFYDRTNEQLNAQSDADKLKEKDRGAFASNSFSLSLFSGVFPGAKWCGLGDVAKNYHDLGTEKADLCCRSHDICPVKLRSYQTRYGITNNSIYTKSHCVCDDLLYDCLKKTNTTTSQLMGNIYFNLVQVPCLFEDSSGVKLRKARDGF